MDIGENNGNHAGANMVGNKMNRPGPEQPSIITIMVDSEFFNEENENCEVHDLKKMVFMVDDQFGSVSDVCKSVQAALKTSIPLRLLVVDEHGNGGTVVVPFAISSRFFHHYGSTFRAVPLPKNNKNKTIIEKKAANGVGDGIRIEIENKELEDSTSKVAQSPPSLLNGNEMIKNVTTNDDIDNSNRREDIAFKVSPSSNLSNGNQTNMGKNLSSNGDNEIDKNGFEAGDIKVVSNASIKNDESMGEIFSSDEDDDEEETDNIFKVESNVSTTNEANIETDSSSEEEDDDEGIANIFKVSSSVAIKNEVNMGMNLSSDDEDYEIDNNFKILSPLQSNFLNGIETNMVKNLSNDHAIENIEVDEGNIENQNESIFNADMDAEFVQVLFEDQSIGGTYVPMLPNEESNDATVEMKDGLIIDKNYNGIAGNAESGSNGSNDFRFEDLKNDFCNKVAESNENDDNIEMDYESSENEISVRSNNDFIMLADLSAISPGFTLEFDGYRSSNNPYYKDGDRYNYAVVKNVDEMKHLTLYYLDRNQVQKLRHCENLSSFPIPVGRAHERHVDRAKLGKCVKYLVDVRQ